MYLKWRDLKVGKSILEREYLGITNAHGKRFSKIVRDFFGIETEKEHPLAAKNRVLRQALKDLGVDPDQLLAHQPKGGHDLG